ncbi:hypothetical protein B7P43_G09441 [Cryptotermes secundus]|uniref:Uncharacterized protein n=1 Tax=Cryptotermes secundus TaxID=105785 RepID=A0A2J7R4W9_9NEOP|nr:hypothetical protein B7P43_G09441 [Cryptotermes secundus]
MRQHSQLRLRKPQPTAAARSKGFLSENVLKISDIYEPLLEDTDLSTSSVTVTRPAYQRCSIRCVAWSRWKASDRLQHHHPHKEVYSSQLSQARALPVILCHIS